MAAGGGRPGGAARAALRVRQRAVPRAAAEHDLCGRARVRAGQLHVRELLRPRSKLPLRRRRHRARDGADRERHGRAPPRPGGLPRPRGAARRPERRASRRGLQRPRVAHAPVPRGLLRVRGLLRPRRGLRLRRRVRPGHGRGLRAGLRSRRGEARWVVPCAEINQCVGCTRQFFTKSFLGNEAADLARSSGEEPASSRRRVDGVEDDAAIQDERALKY